jgi:hypothetical protein
VAVTKQRGGAKVGWLNMSWPFAGLEVSPGNIQLSAFGKYRFTPDEVVSVEAIGFIPFFYYGVRIHHNKPDYPERIVFFTSGSRRALIETTAAAGFHTGAAPMLQARGFPLKIVPLIVAVALWNALLLLDMQRSAAEIEGPGILTLAAFWIVFALTTLLPRSAQLQKIFLRDGRKIGEILPALRFTSWLLGAMALVFSILLLVSASEGT